LAEEKFKDPDYAAITQHQELNLYKNLQWTLWEFIEFAESRKQQKTDDYLKCCRKVAWFENAITFHQAWNSIPHA